jgi:hypothetical protein
MLWKTPMLGLLLTFSNMLMYQEKHPPEARLIRTFYKGDFLHANNEAALDLRAWAGGPDDRIAVRICSKEPMPVAVAVASGRPFLLVSNLTNHGYSQERILFLRSDSCLGNDPAIAVTEFWAIPKGASLPPSTESIKSSQIKAESLMNERSKNNKSYTIALQKLITLLRAKPEASGVVVGYYNKSPSLVLKRKLQKARSFLKNSRLPGKRYFVRSLPWTGNVDPVDPEPDFPDVIVVEVKKTANRNGSFNISK